MQTSIGDLMVANAVSMEMRSGACITKISHWQITNWCRLHFKYNAIIPMPVRDALQKKGFLFIVQNTIFTKFKVKISNKVWLPWIISYIFTFPYSSTLSTCIFEGGRNIRLLILFKFIWNVKHMKQNNLHVHVMLIKELHKILLCTL